MRGPPCQLAPLAVHESDTPDDSSDGQILMMMKIRVRGAVYDIAAAAARMGITWQYDNSRRTILRRLAWAGSDIRLHARSTRAADWLDLSRCTCASGR